MEVKMTNYDTTSVGLLDYVGPQRHGEL